jgi:CMP-N,N'-diacetyllegionaminic acid synthase
MNTSEIIALIPARSGSKRIKNKNIRELNGHPLLAYTIAAAIESVIFSRVIVSTESKEIASIAKKYGAEVPFMRPAEYSENSSADIDWVKHLLSQLNSDDELPELFSILRPTSPFRNSNTIRRAWQEFKQADDPDSLRAVELCSQHPGKMWFINNNMMTPVMSNPNKSKAPWHSSPYQSLPKIYVQNASLEIAKSSIPLTTNSISGNKIIPFITTGYEGFDINLPLDWLLAEVLIKNKLALLPKISEQTI